MPNIQAVKDKAAKADAQQGTSGLLTKKVETAEKVMKTKKFNPNQSWQVYLLVDRSGSMGREYQAGSVLKAVESALAFAAIVDDDGSVPTAFFDSELETHTIKLDNFHNFVDNHRINARYSTGLTEALEWVGQETGNGDLFSGGGFLRRDNGSPSVKKMDTPAFVIVITDGRPDNPGSATDAIRRLSNRGIFIKFLYVGTDNNGWRFLESLDDDIPVGVSFDQGGRLIDNVDAKKLSSLSSTDDQVFYEAMFDEVPTYLQAARHHGLI